MQKNLLVLYALILTVGVYFLFWTSPYSATSQQALQQAGSVAAEETTPLAESTLESPAAQPRERSNQVAAPSIEATPTPTAEEALMQEGPEDFTEVIGEPAVTFTVRAFVVDWAKQPIAETELTLGYEALPRGSEPIDKSLAQYDLVTDKDGRLQVTLILPNHELKQIAIWVEDKSRQAQGWVEPVRVIVGGRGDLGTIRIFETREKFPAPLVQGQVLSEDGSVVPGCTGSISMDQEEGTDGLGNSWPSRMQGQVLIDAKGHFQAFGPSSWDRATVSMNAQGFMSAFASASNFPKTDLQITLYRRLRLKGTLHVPTHGPPIHEYGIWLSQKGMSVGISPNSHGNFSSVGSSQSLSVKVTHPGMGVVLFKHEFLMAPSEEAGLGTIDLRDQVRVLDFVIVDGEGSPLGNQEFSLEAPEMKTLGGSFKTNDHGRLLTVVPIGVESIRLIRKSKGNTSPPATVEVDLTAFPSEVVLP